MKGSDHVLFSCTIPVFGWRNWGKPGTASLRTALFRDNFGTWHLPRALTTQPLPSIDRWASEETHGNSITEIDLPAPIRNRSSNEYTAMFGDRKEVVVACLNLLACHW